MGKCMFCDQPEYLCECPVAQVGLPGMPLRKPRAAPILGNQHHEAVDPVKDVPRLLTQYDLILKYMRDYQWHTLFDIAEATKTPHGSVGSQIRNARVTGYKIEKRRTADGAGTWEYRLVR